MRFYSRLKSKRNQHIGLLTDKIWDMKMCRPNHIASIQNSPFALPAVGWASAYHAKWFRLFQHIMQKSFWGPLAGQTNGPVWARDVICRKMWSGGCCRLLCSREGVWQLASGLEKNRRRIDPGFPVTRKEASSGSIERRGVFICRRCLSFRPV